MADILALQKHYRVKEISRMWGISIDKAQRLFADEPNVARISKDGPGRKRTTLMIPESVVLHVHERLSNDGLQATPARRNPLRVIHLRDSNRRMPK